jgi:hypothetical protein
VTGITLSEAWKRMAKAPRPPLRACLSPNRAAFARTTTGCVACRANHAWLGPVPPAKTFRFAVPPNHPYNFRHPVPARGAYRDLHGRWAWDAMDAAASGARGVAGRISVSDRPARRRPALKRLRRISSKGFGGGSRGRQSTRGWCQADGDWSRPTGCRQIVNSSAMEARGIRLRESAL